MNTIFFFIINGEVDLMIALIGIRNDNSSHDDDLTNTRQVLLVFGTCFIQTGIIDTHAPGAIRHFYKYRVC
jgi:hypothetical protein